MNPNIDPNIDEATRNFLIDATGGDHTVDLYDEWCSVSETMQYDHASANSFLLSALSDYEPAVMVLKIMNGFALAAHSQASQSGIVLNPNLTHPQLLTWVKSMCKLGSQENYADIKDALSADIEDKEKLQRVFEIIGPGTDEAYADMIFSVESGVIDGIKETIEEIETSPESTQKTVVAIKEKIDRYNLFKSKITGEVYSDRFASRTSSYDMDFDRYLTAMKVNQDFYNDPNNYDEFIIDMIGCLILSNAKKEDYSELMQASTHEFFDNEKEIIEIKKLITDMSFKLL